MKLEELLNELDFIKAQAEIAEDPFYMDLLKVKLIELLVSYINNPKLEEKVNEITF